jgi:cap1 methyltransferase
MASSFLDGPQRKRARHQFESHNNHQHVEENDCYDEVTMHGIFEDHVGSLRQNWLVRQEWFSEFQPIAEQTATERAGEISSLHRQLIEIKRLLLPAANAAAEVCNSNLEMGDIRAVLSPQQIFEKARRHCNPMEALGEGRAGGLNKLFVNRSAVKLSNVNASLGFVLTQAASQGTFQFVDLCAAPGGFSEYLFHHCRTCYPSVSAILGIGMSLIGTNENGRGADWKVDNYDSHNMQYRVCTGVDGTGDIYNWDNVMALKAELNGMEVHAVVCDGGVDAQRNHEYQEQLSQKLVVCQVAAALSIVSPGGCVLVKLFGCQTDVIRTMMKDLAIRFEDFIITKPISSRPASAERYLVLVGCKGVGLNFQGRKWRDSIFLANSGSDVGSYKDQKVELYLDLLDRDMQLLNIKACFAILSQIKIWQVGENEETYCANIQAYKHAWRL